MHRIQYVMDQKPFSSFSEASRYTLKYLRKKYGYGAWLMTRKNEDEWVILQVEGDGYQIDELSVINWNDSMCSRMVKQEGPRWAPNVDEISSYVEAPIYQAHSIKSYVGVPVCYANGEVFGTLCAIDTEPTGRQPADGIETVELMSKLLASLLQLELDNLSIARKQMNFLPEQLKDKCTGFLNRMGWSICLEKESQKVRELGTPLYVVALDIKLLNLDEDNEAVSRQLSLTTSILSLEADEHHFVARLNENIFTILCTTIMSKQVEQLVSNLQMHFRAVDIDVAIGVEKHNYRDNIETTVMSAIKSTKSS
ncbi:hypothetical protein GCM10007938_31210 [Vibrio zhanjiangensis]|uniref:GGDEF domain-containing protein n=1 Tax=Vibrio zhanjiangensis TaxID=1046128 RepID=A0ABQ6F2Y5_9VIBR|nr:GAF domain-containing protein [Vibrio zhanjiangensis]GLT19339.1 hypothetical protein GCM10007938_31210 [Vibrio zhanjiangensis]